MLFSRLGIFVSLISDRQLEFIEHSDGVISASCNNVRRIRTNLNHLPYRFTCHTLHRSIKVVLAQSSTCRFVWRQATTRLNLSWLLSSRRTFWSQNTGMLRSFFCLFSHWWNVKIHCCLRMSPSAFKIVIHAWLVLDRFIIWPPKYFGFEPHDYFIF